MANVALDAKSNWSASHNAVASFTDASFTVGSGANRGLVVALVVEVTSGSNPTAPTANWDSTGTNQPMTLIHTQTDTGNSNVSSFLFGLAAPTSGNKTLSIAGLTTASDSIVSYISFTNVDQTGGTTTFKSATGSSVASATTITASPIVNSGDAVVAVFGGNDGVPTVNQTAWAAAALTTNSTDYWISNYAIATGIMAMTMTQGTSTHCNANAIAINQISSTSGSNAQFDARGTSKLSGASASSITYNGLTVGASATSLLAFVATLAPAGTVTMVWDSGGTNQSMTLLDSLVNGAAASFYLFGLVNPTAGNKNLLVTLGTANAYLVNACSFTGTLNTSAATTFINIAHTDHTVSATSTSQTGTISNSGTSIGMGIATIGLNNPATSRSDTLWFDNNVTSDFTVDAQYNIGPTGTSHNWTWNYGTSTVAETVCVEVVSAPAAPPPPVGYVGYKMPSNLLSMGGPLAHARMGPLNAALPTPVVTVTGGSTLPMMGVG